MSKTKKRILFVCLGNICRSPAAEGVMRKMVTDAGQENLYYIDSAGIGNWHVGQLPDWRMRQCGAERGYRFDSHARQFDRRHDFIDSCTMMSHYGHRLGTIIGPMENIKITTPTDYFVLRAMVKVHEDQQIFGL